MRYSIVPRTKKYVNLYGFLFLGRILSNKYGRQLLDTATKTASQNDCSMKKNDIFVPSPCIIMKISKNHHWVMGMMGIRYLVAFHLFWQTFMTSIVCISFSVSHNTLLNNFAYDKHMF